MEVSLDTAIGVVRQFAEAVGMKRQAEIQGTEYAKAIDGLRPQVMETLGRIQLSEQQRQQVTDLISAGVLDTLRKHSLEFVANAQGMDGAIATRHRAASAAVESIRAHMKGAKGADFGRRVRRAVEALKG